MRRLGWPQVVDSPSSALSSRRRTIGSDAITSTQGLPTSATRRCAVQMVRNGFAASSNAPRETGRCSRSAVAKLCSGWTPAPAGPSASGRGAPADMRLHGHKMATAPTTVTRNAALRSAGRCMGSVTGFTRPGQRCAPDVPSLRVAPFADAVADPGSRARCRLRSLSGPRRLRGTEHPAGWSFEAECRGLGHDSRRVLDQRVQRHHRPAPRLRWPAAWEVSLSAHCETSRS